MKAAMGHRRTAGRAAEALVLMAVGAQVLAGCTSSQPGSIRTGRTTPTTAAPTTTAPLTTTAPASTTPTGPSVEQAAQVFLRDVNTVNPSIVDFGETAALWTSQTTIYEAASDAHALVAPLEWLEIQLQATVWPVVAQADVSQLLASIGAVVSDLQDTTYMADFGLARWATMFNDHDQAMYQVDASVRTDLGLPPTG
jgi:hypothetical protein